MIEDESYEDAHGSPEQVEGAEAQRDSVLSIDRALSRLHGRRVGEQRAQAHLLAIRSRTPPSTRPRRWRAVIGHGVDSYPRDQMIALTQEAPDDFLAGIVRVGDEVERLVYAQRAEQEEHLVEQGSSVSIG
jgi:hypothetical protein